MQEKIASIFLRRIIFEKTKQNARGASKLQIIAIFKVKLRIIKK